MNSSNVLLSNEPHPSITNKNNKIKDRTHLKFRYKVQKEAELSLAYNNQAISPASLQPHKYFQLYPLKEECFADVDDLYYKFKEKQKEQQLASTISPTSPLELTQSQNKARERTRDRDPDESIPQRIRKITKFSHHPIH